MVRDRSERYQSVNCTCKTTDINLIHSVDVDMNTAQRVASSEELNTAANADVPDGNADDEGSRDADAVPEVM